MKVVIHDSRASTLMRLEYPTDDVDQRVLTVAGLADPFQPSDIAGVQAGAWLVSASVRGEVPLEVMQAIRKSGALVGADVQGYVRVVGDDDPKKVREQGQAMRTVRFAGLQDLVIGSRQRQAIRLEIEFTADLRLADAVEKSTTFIIPGEGIVAEISHETVKVLGAFGKTSSRTIVITSPSEP